MEEQNTEDRSARASEQLMIDTTLSIVEKHKNLPPGEKETFALAFKKLNDSLASHQDQKLKRLQAIPQRLPDAIIQPKVTFVPGRKRALTGKEAADHQEKEEARERRRAQIQAEKQLQNNTRQAQAAAVHSQFITDIAAAYTGSQGTKSYDIIEISSETDNKSNEFEDIDSALVQIQSQAKSVSLVSSPNQQFFNSTTFSSINSTSNSTSKSTFKSTFISTSDSSPISPNSASKSTLSLTSDSAVVSSSNRPTRQRKPTSKQASQNRCTIENEEKKKAKLTKKPKTTNTTQLDQFKLPFRSSQ
jgi:hypothetical protein